MATDHGPARLALAAAVVALLLGAGGVLVQQRLAAAGDASEVTGAAGATLTVGDIEVVVPPDAVVPGTRLSGRPAPEPGALTPAARRSGGGAELTFDAGVRPRLPVQVRIPVPAAPPPGFAPVVVTANGTRLALATYDSESRRIVADLAPDGAFWGGLLDFAALGRAVGQATADPPATCLGRAAGSAGLTVEVGGTAGTDPRSPVRACVAANGGGASVTLTSNARVPYRLVLPPGWPEPTARTAAPSTSAVQLFPQPRFHDLLWPGAGVTYDVPVTRLPATLHGQADPGPYLGLALAWTAHRAAGLFGMALDRPGELEQNPGVLACAAEAGAAHYTADRPFAQVAAETWTALATCGTADAGALHSFLAAGIGPLTGWLADAAGSPGVDVPLTASRGTGPFTQAVVYRAWTGTRVAAGIRTTAASGTCPAGSAVSGRHDAYRCTAGDKAYDPCFAATAANARHQVVCPTSATRAVLLTYPGALPSPPAAGGTASPFLLTLQSGLQCTAAPPPASYTCTDGRTVLSGEPDTSTPLWTVPAGAAPPATITKAYT
ncbi:hypothetical protein ACGFMK_43945 [Amycolatopsis sp. NPDC049252]|uniref:hypothetical protein n=1 Tax=Amycolatopsis sp. NPDC049252 TaxID=3363933 RepID=UPI00371F7F04